MDQRLTEPAGGALAKPVVEEPTDEELLEINDGAYCPCADEVNGEDDSSWQYTSDYIRWLDENGTPQEQGAYAAKGLRAVFEAGRRFGHQPAPPVEGEVGELAAWLRANSSGVYRPCSRAADLLEQQATAYAICERERLHQSTRAADLEIERHPVPVPVAALSSDYREPWDMSSEDGSQCFASAILSRLVGVDAADEADARWLAAYLQANSRPQHFQPAPVPVSERLPELTEAFKDLPPGRIELLPEDAQVIEPTEHTILVPARTPVPVAERLPGPEDCDAEGRCWLLGKVERDWRLINPEKSGVPQLKYCFSHWLPATALPLPAGEVK